MDSKSRSRSRDWSMLPDLILDLIFQKLPSISDCLRFSLVCKSWFSFMSNNYDVLQQRIKSNSIEQLPLLMIFTENDHSITYASLYDVAKNKIVSHLQLPLPNQPSQCCGSSHGWLAFQQRIKSTFHNLLLFIPFSSETIYLPNLDTYIDKIILSKNPSTNPHDFEVAALCKDSEGDKLAILKPGNNTWFISIFSGPRPCDFIHYNERYYVVGYGGSILSTNNNANLRYETAPQSLLNAQFYFVKTTNNELLRVERTHPLHETCSSVKISKLVTNPKTQKSMFVNVDDLGDEALFVCHHGATSVSASKFSGCKSNSIYYMDRFYTQSHFTNMPYSLQNINLHDGTYYDQFSFYANAFLVPLALWLTPTPNLPLLLNKYL